MRETSERSSAAERAPASRVRRVWGRSPRRIRRPQSGGLRRLMEQLKGRVAVVTGGASGIGRAMGERLGQEGMKVVLADVEAPALEPR